jgi:hypothetical protein
MRQLHRLRLTSPYGYIPAGLHGRLSTRQLFHWKCRAHKPLAFLVQYGPITHRPVTAAVELTWPQLFKRSRNYREISDSLKSTLSRAALLIPSPRIYVLRRYVDSLEYSRGLRSDATAYRYIYYYEVTCLRYSAGISNDFRQMITASDRDRSAAGVNQRDVRFYRSRDSLDGTTVSMSCAANFSGDMESDSMTIVLTGGTTVPSVDRIRRAAC